MKFKSLYNCLMVLFISISLNVRSQTVLTITDPTAGNSGSADVILAQAETLANSGQNVIVNMNAPALCEVITMYVLPTAGSITIQKDPSANTVQGFGLSAYSGSSYGLFIESNEITNVTIKEITFENYGYPIWVYGINNFLLDDVKFMNCGGMVNFDDYYGPHLATQNILIQNCEFENTTNLNFGRPQIWRQNQKNNTPHKTFKVLNNQFKSHLNVRVSSNAIFDDLEIEIKNNQSTNLETWASEIGLGDYGSNPVSRTGDYGFKLVFENNTDVSWLSLIAPLNDWKVENNIFDWHNYLGYVYLFIENGFNTSSKASLINSSINSCANQSFLNGNNTFNYRSDYPWSPVNIQDRYYSAFVNGNNAPGCAVTELNGLELPGSITISGNVSVRKCKIFSSQGKDKPLKLGSHVVSSTVTAFSTTGGNLNFGYIYTGITPANNNDLYVDVYKSNVNGDLLDYIGEQYIPASAINGQGHINLPIPVGVTLTQSDRIAITLTGLHSQGSSNVVAMGTSRAFYNQQPCCEMTENYVGLTINNFPVYIDNDGLPYYNNCSGEAFTVGFHCPGGTMNPYSYWDFGDGTIVGQNGGGASHTYANNGNYQIYGIYSEDNECFMSVGPINVTVNEDNCHPQTCDQASIILPDSKQKTCYGTEVHLSASDCLYLTTIFNWNFGDGLTGTGANVSHIYQYPGTYNIQLTVIQPGHANIVTNSTIVIDDCVETDCKDCIGSFQPSPGNYILSLWVKEDVTTLPKSYDHAKVEINFLGVTGGSTPITVSTNGAKNKIIDGWQRIEEQFTIPPTATNLKLKLLNTNTGNTDVYFDDIRVFPTDGQMKTYVYDPITLRLSATLDENNYATFYEYDEEGKLIRVKKETEKGVMTIQESREGTKKK